MLNKIKPNIVQKVNLIFLAFGLLLLLSFTIPAYWIGRNLLEEYSISKLQAVGLQKQLTLEGWLSYTQSMIEGIASAPRLQKDLNDVYDSSPGSGARQQAVNWLTRDMEIWAQSERIFASFTVIDQASGTIIASTEPEEIGEKVINEPYFLNGKKSVFIQNPYYSELLNEPVMRISLPFQALENRGNAVLAVQIKLTKVIEIIQRGTNEYDLGDVYLVNQDYQVVVQPRFLRNAQILHETLHSEAIDRCVQGQSGGLAARDYRGVAVITSYTWLPERQLCLVVEEQQVKAFADIHRFTNLMLLSAFLAIILALFLANRLSRMMTKPVFTLLEHIHKFGPDPLDRQIVVKTADEFGMLSQAINRLALNFSNSILDSNKIAQENTRLYQVAQERAEELQEERKFSDELLDTSASLIIVIDNQGRIVKHNQTIETMTGYAYDEIDGRSYIEILQGPLGMFQNIPSLEDLLAGEFPKQFEKEFVSNNGERKQITWSSNALYDRSGEIELIISVGIEITEHKQTEKKLRDSERNFHIALSAAPISIYTTDQDLRITFMRDPHPNFNEADVLGKRMDEFLPPEIAQQVLSTQRLVLESQVAHRGQIFTKNEDGIACYDYYADPIFNSSGAIVGMACAGYDITELKKSEQALLEIKLNLEQIVEKRTSELVQSHKILQTMLNAIPESAALLDKDGTVLAGNQTLAERVKTRMDLLIGAKIYDFFSPEVAASRKNHVDKAFFNGKPNRYMDTRDGRFFDNMLYPVLNEAGQVTALAIISMDVTNWKQTEDAIKAGRERLKDLTRKVVVAQEEERRRISRELHDEAGQALTALSISLKLLYVDMPENLIEEKKRLADAVFLVVTTMEQIRVLAQNLRPQALDALGLNETLEGFCREFARRTRIEIFYQGTEVLSLPDITSVSLYRFLQEALTNSARHSGAKHIYVTLMLNEEILELIVQDHGVGFELDASGQNRENKTSHGIGLLGMRERIEMLGGTMQIHSQPGQGTRLVATIHITGEYIDKRGKNDSSRNRG